MYDGVTAMMKEEVNLGGAKFNRDDLLNFLAPHFATIKIDSKATKITT